VFAIRARTREGASASICRADRRFRGVVEMPSHGPGLRDHIYFFFQPSFFSIPFFFHRRYCTSIFIPPHVPARRPARWWTRGKMQPPNTIDRYKHTRNYHGRVLLRVQRFARPVGSQRAEGDRKSSAPSKGRRSTGGRGYPLEQEARQRWTRRGEEGSGEEERRGEEEERREGGRARNVRFRPCSTLARERIAAPPSPPPPRRRCSCRLRGVGAVLMPNVFVPMHQPLLPRSGGPRDHRPRGLLRARFSSLPPGGAPDPARSPRVSVLASLVGLARCSSLKRARVAQKCRMSGRTRAETRVTPGIALSNVTQPRHLRHRSLCPPLPPPHTLGGTARPRRTVCVLF